MSEGRKLGSNSEYDYLFKVLIIGDSGTGKSCLMTRFVDDTYSDHFISTIGVDFKIKTLSLQEKVIKLQIWDTAGQDRFRAITQSYYHGAHGILVVYDVTNKPSFDHLQYWFGEINQHANPNVVTVLVGNKIDLVKDRVVDRAEAMALAESKSIKYLESSAKSGENVLDAFMNLITEIVTSISQTQRKSSTVQPGPGAPVRSGNGCC
eukprot:TRINITY_DN1773_c0_g1_i1.p1 TRINITY_DN1773_c0_g1~~TRINITY_DN1773_c0_g1_i1.p1  ORF type:complete len:207 (+),score=42.76 TRINITY_DN1773_c0_g1_i1:49-669(+)